MHNCQCWVVALQVLSIVFDSGNLCLQGHLVLPYCDMLLEMQSLSAAAYNLKLTNACCTQGKSVLQSSYWLGLAYNATELLWESQDGGEWPCAWARHKLQHW